MIASWWSFLLPDGAFYWAVAVFATVLQICLLLGSFMGAGGDYDTDAGGGDMSDSGHGPKLLSLRAVTAFFVGFGWAGVLCMKQGMSGMATVGTAVTVGLIFAVVLAALLGVMLSLRADGTMDFKNAIGVSGKVYVTIPPARGGPGQVELLLQGRLITASAVTDSPAALAPQSPVRVVAAEPGNVLLVAPA